MRSRKGRKQALSEDRKPRVRVEVQNGPEEEMQEQVKMVLENSPGTMVGLQTKRVMLPTLKAMLGALGGMGAGIKGGPVGMSVGSLVGTYVASREVIKERTRHKRYLTEGETNTFIAHLDPERYEEITKTKANAISENKVPIAIGDLHSLEIEGRVQHMLGKLIVNKKIRRMGVATQIIEGMLDHIEKQAANSDKEHFVEVSYAFHRGSKAMMEKAGIKPGDLVAVKGDEWKTYRELMRKKQELEDYS